MRPCDVVSRDRELKLHEKELESIRARFDGSPMPEEVRAQVEAMGKRCKALREMLGYQQFTEQPAQARRLTLRDVM